LKTLPFWLPLLRRKRGIRSKSNPIRSATPATEPTTIPAIAPPDNPFFELAGVLVPDAEGDDVDVAVGDAVEKVMKAVIVGNTTPTHLWFACEL
jgi:hypothetical protein